MGLSSRIHDASILHAVQGAASAVSPFFVVFGSDANNSATLQQLVAAKTKRPQKLLTSVVEWRKNPNDCVAPVWRWSTDSRPGPSLLLHGHQQGERQPQPSGAVNE
jgi:hypothetical protein